MAYSNYNTGANIVGGAGAGAAVGTSIMPGWGTAIGAGVGALVGVFQSIAEYDNEKKRREAVQRLSEQIGVNYKDLQKKFDSFYSNYKPAGTQEDMDKAANAIREFDYSKYDWLDTNHDGFISDLEKENAQYKYDKTVDDFVTPYLEDLQSDAAAKVEHTAAGAGLGRGTGAARAVANSVADIKDKAYKTALQQYNAEKQFDYNVWSDYNQSMRDRLNNMMTTDQWQIGQMQELGNSYLDWETNKFTNYANLERDKTNAQMQIGLAGL